MDFLLEIINHKTKEVTERKTGVPVRTLERSSYYTAPVVSLKRKLLQADQSGVIAEIKRKSPSKGVFRDAISVNELSRGYVQAGASALSILTDTYFFGGTNADLEEAHKFNQCPILRKDFILDEYQIIEAKSIGADAILLIAAALQPSALKRLTRFAHSLHLEVLMEVHNERELEANAESDFDLVGVNNRNLQTFQVNIETSQRLAGMIPDSVVKISESGIESPKTVLELKRLGYRGFLIGQIFMQAPQPEVAAKEFIDRIREMEFAHIK